MEGRAGMDMEEVGNIEIWKARKRQLGIWRRSEIWKFGELENKNEEIVRLGQVRLGQVRGREGVNGYGGGWTYGNLESQKTR